MIRDEGNGTARGTARLHVELLRKSAMVHDTDGLWHCSGYALVGGDRGGAPPGGGGGASSMW